MANIYGRDSDGSLTKRWGSSRTDKRVQNNLGIIYSDLASGTYAKFRRQCLEDYDAIYECRQYSHLIPWDAAAQRACQDGDFIGVRKRQPRINFAFAKVLASRLTSKLVGEDTFPRVIVDGLPDETEFVKSIIEWSDLRLHMLEPTRRLLNTGSVFVRFSLMGGAFKIEHALSKYCYPVFDDAGQLESLEIRYVYSDSADVDSHGKPRQKWYKLELGRFADVLYDNPDYVPGGGAPQFSPVETVEHDLGFVQGTWFRTSEDKHSPDGYAMVEDLVDLIDEINYSLSQSSQAVSYNQEPQLTVSGMDSEELDHIVKTSQKALNLGRDGKAAYLETNMGGVETAMKLQDKMRVGIQDIARVVLLDPEKFASHAQSGRAMEILHGPMVELLKELRPVMKKGMTELITKMALAALIWSDRGLELALEMPPGWKPESLTLKFIWPPIFPMTLEDLGKKVSLAVSAANARLISSEAGTRYLAEDFNIEDVEEELRKIEAQPVMNPFGGF